MTPNKLGTTAGGWKLPLVAMALSEIFPLSAHMVPIGNGEYKLERLDGRHRAVEKGFKNLGF